MGCARRFASSGQYQSLVGQCADGTKPSSKPYLPEGVLDVQTFDGQVGFE